MVEPLRAVRCWVDGLHFNETGPGLHEATAVWRKRRRRIAWLVMKMANGFFRLARNPVEAIADPVEWRAWEIGCFQRLHGEEGARAGNDAAGAVWFSRLPGEPLSAALENASLTPAMLIAAAREMHRAHRLVCGFYRAAWSHGDPHTGNFLFDTATGRARLIDFEMRHYATLTEHERHADDLLVLLQDVCGRCEAMAWPGLAAAVCEGYDDAKVLAVLRRKLRVPHGLPRLWWAVRTTWMRRAELEHRLAELEAMLP